MNFGGQKFQNFCLKAENFEKFLDFGFREGGGYSLYAVRPTRSHMNSTPMCNIHQHTETCHKPPNPKCRMGLPRPTITHTQCVQIVPVSSTAENPEKFVVLPVKELPIEETQESTNLYLNPIPSRDGRTLIWEQKRPQILLPIATQDKRNQVAGVDYLELPGELKKEYDLLPLNIRQRVNRVMEKRNSLVVEYNKIASALLGCNSNASFLGSELQANLALCYILVYMVKPSAPLLKSVALILNARQEIEKQPSVAKDSGTPKRTAMHLLNKMVNNIRGLKEISAQTAAACVLGMPAETCTHEFHLAFVDAALKYLDELHADNKKGYRFYNKKC